CTVCGSELSRTLQTTPAIGHDWGAPLYIWSADLGHATARSVCSHDSSHVTEETSGSFYAETNPPGCETEGIGVYTVSFVNPLFSTQASMRMIPALGHDWGEWSITTAPTPTSDGVKTRTCSRCGSTETEAVTYEEALLPFPVVSSVSASGDNVTVGYDDYSGDADGVMLFIAAYDTNGKLISFVMTAPDKSGSVTVSMKLTGVKSIKVFVLDTYNGFLPLTEAFEQPV
ncbi:MAG: hypothetical protein IIY69_00680, partial [Clostridia bacterium]|nr:hypothetical protein [Clostridia bacterium]